MRLIVLILILPLALFAAPAAAQTPDAESIVAAERAFAADAPGLGITGSFTKWSVNNAVIIAGGRAMTVREAYPPSDPRPADEPLLVWWPNFAGISLSGDLGFTTGGVEVNGNRAGHYFSVWRLEIDGSWKWIYDGGTNATAADVPGPDTEPVILPVATVSSDGPRAWVAVNEAEDRLALRASIDQKQAHLDFLAPDGRLYVAARPPALGAADFPSALDAWPATFAFGSTEGGYPSDAGDMVWTYGPAAWTQDGQPRHGHYVRVWQKRPEGWRIVLAQLITAPTPPD